MTQITKTSLWNDQTKFRLFAILGVLGIGAYFIGITEFLAADRTVALRPIALSAIIPVAIFIAAYNLLPRFRTFVLAQDLHTLTVLQSWRVIGISMLFLYAYNVLPGLFAWPAGLGDVAVGLAAPFVAMQLARNPAFAQSRRFLTFHAMGLLDFAIAISTAFLTSGAYPAIYAGTVTSAPMEVWPLNLFPSFGVPLFIILHLIVFLKVRHLRKTNTDQLNVNLQTA